MIALRFLLRCFYSLSSSLPYNCPQGDLTIIHHVPDWVWRGAEILSSQHVTHNCKMNLYQMLKFVYVEKVWQVPVPKSTWLLIPDSGLKKKPLQLRFCSLYTILLQCFSQAFQKARHVGFFLMSGSSKLTEFANPFYLKVGWWAVLAHMQEAISRCLLEELMEWNPWLPQVASCSFPGSLVASFPSLVHFHPPLLSGWTSGVTYSR